MRTIYIGTALLMSVCVLAPVLMYVQASQLLIAIVCGLMATTGFVMQMYGAFKIRSDSQRYAQQCERETAALIAKAKKLPPEEGVALLMAATD